MVCANLSIELWTDKGADFAQTGVVANVEAGSKPAGSFIQDSEYTHGKAFCIVGRYSGQKETLEILADGVYALTAEGDPNVGAFEGKTSSLPSKPAPRLRPRETGWPSCASTRKSPSNI